MITYRYEEEKIIAMYFAERLNDPRALQIINSSEIRSKEEADYLSKFFWKMNEKAIKDDELGVVMPCEGSSEYWLEKIYNSWEGYMLKNGFSEEWDSASEDA